MTTFDSLRALGWVALFSVFGAALLTPEVYSLLTLIWTGFPWPFSRVFDRVFLFLVIVSIVIWRKKLSVPEIRVLFSHPHKFKLLSAGAILACASACLVLPLCVGTGNGLIWREELFSVFLSKLPNALLSAIVVSLLEEIIFRGIVLQALSKRLNYFFAASIVSAVYASVHFFAPDKSFPYDHFSPLAGFSYLAVITARLNDVGILSGMFGLWLVGIVLCEATRITQSLWLPIGLHAGWIMAVKMSFYLTFALPEANFPEALGRRYFLVGEPIVWCTVLVVLLVVRLVCWNGRATNT